MVKKIQSIADVAPEAFKGKRVAVRVGFDVPIQDGVVTNDFRIRESLPTITLLKNAGAKIILLSHCGRDPKASLAPVALALQKHVSAQFVPHLLGIEVETAIAKLNEGEIVLLENLRSDARETENDEAFAKQLAALADVYVNDAFSVAHRAHASVVGIPAHLPSYAGISFMHEIEALEKALTPQAPSLMILGGAKFDTKLPLVQKFLPLYDTLFIGGALANDLWRARGVAIGTSLVSEGVIDAAIRDSEKIVLPTDVVVKNAAVEVRTTTPDAVREDESILDCGPETADFLKKKLMGAKTVLWNGPLGYYEGGFTKGTQAIARVIAEAEAFSVVGGGDTVGAIETLGINDQFGFVSTAGGAMLEFLEKGTLPAILALEK